jgi:hypothetical protein
MRRMDGRGIRRRSGPVVAAAFVAGLALAGCGGDDDPVTPPPGVQWTRITSSGAASEAVPSDWSASGILLSYSDQGYTHLATVQPDGSGLFYLTALPTEAISPLARWVAGTTLAYASNRSGSYDLWRRGIPDSTVWPMTAFPEDEFDPAPRPGAPGIAYTEGAALTGRVTLIPDTAAAPLARIYLTIAAMKAGEAAWDPTGTRVCFTAEGTSGSRHVWLVSLAAGDSTPVQLTTGAVVDQGPRFSPDGTQIVFASNRGSRPGLWVVSPAGEGTFLRAIAYDDSLPASPAWSPDGSKIVVSSTRLGFGRCLWVLSNLP